MREIVSVDEGYTFFIDKKGCICYETGNQMNGQDIANELNITKVAVSQNLKKALTKIYKHLKIRNRELTSIDIALIMTEMFELKTEVQYEKFYRLLSFDIKREITLDAYRKGYCRN